MEPASRKSYWTAKFVQSRVGDEVGDVDCDSDENIDSECLESCHNEQDGDAVDDE